jgi:hypothetical protein
MGDHAAAIVTNRQAEDRKGGARIGSGAREG